MFPLFFSSTLGGPEDRFTFGILPKVCPGGGRGDILPSLSLGDPDPGDVSFDLALFLVSDLTDSSLDLVDLELDLLLLDLELEELDFEELDFLESDLEVFDGLSFLDLESESLGDVPDSTLLESFLSTLLDAALRLGSLLLGSLLGSVFSSTYVVS